jgi:hypothetical protein
MSFGLVLDASDCITYKLMYKNYLLYMRGVETAWAKKKGGLVFAMRSNGPHTQVNVIIQLMTRTYYIILLSCPRSKFPMSNAANFFYSTTSHGFEQVQVGILWVTIRDIPQEFAVRQCQLHAST